MGKIERSIICYGNDAELFIDLSVYNQDTSEFIDFDLSQVTDIRLFLICSKHSTEIDLEYDIQGEDHNILHANIDYRLLHTNASYGVVCEGYDSEQKHWRFEMLPSEGFLVVPNTSGTKIQNSVTSIMVTGKLGWWMNGGSVEQVQSDWTQTDSSQVDYIKHKPNLEIYATKTELNTKQDTLVSGTNIKTINNQSIVGSGNVTIEATTDYNDLTNKPDLTIYAEKSDLATVATTGNYNDLSNQPDLSQYATQTDLNDKQDQLQSGVNIKTINNESLLGSGNITVGGGGVFIQEQADWTQNDDTKVDYIKNKPILFSGNYNDLTNKPDLSVYAETSNLATVATTGNYEDLSNKPTIPTTTSELTNDSGFLTSAVTSFNEQTGAVTYTAPVTSVNGQTGAVVIETGLDQVNSDWNSTTGVSMILNKPDLSVYAETSNLATVATTGNYEDLSNKPTIPTTTSELTNDSGFLTSAVTSFNEQTGAVTYTAPVTSVNGQTGAVVIEAGTDQVNSDWESTTGVSMILNKPDLSVYAETSDLATVATTGDYDDLTNKPTLFSGNYNDLSNKPDLSVYAETSDLATVATTGDYDDLTNKPTIPTTTSELTNDSGFLTSAVTSFNGATGAITYTAPVTSVNGETGAVTVDPGVTSFNGATGAVTYTAPVISVNGQTGAVVIETGEHDYSKDYLTFEALENTTFTFTKRGSGNDIQYSLDNGTTWTTLASDTASPTVNKGSSIIWKCNRSAGSSGIGTFSSTGKFNASGNVSSILQSNNFVIFGDNPGFTNSLQKLFNGCTTLINTENLCIPFTTLWGLDCYEMFKNCTNLVTAPKILPATTLQQGCYWYMFYGCTSLIKAPELPATTLSQSCYREMFRDCTSLNYIKCLATDISATSCTTWWVYNVASKGLFIPANNSVAWSTGNNGIPTGWTKGTDADDTYVHKYELATVATSGNYNDLSNKPDLSTYATKAELTGYATQTDLATKQDQLVSGVNIKTINEQTILGTGNITIEGGSSESEKVIAEALYKHENEIKGTASRIDTISTDLDNKIETAINEINTKIDTVVDDLVPDINASNRTIAEVVTNIHNKQPIVLEYGQDIPNDVFEDIRNGRRPVVLHVAGGQFPTTSQDTPDYYISDYTVGKTIYEPWIQFNYTLEFFQNYMGVRPTGRQLKVTFRYVATKVTDKWEKTTHSIVTSSDVLFIKQVTEMPQAPEDYTLYLVVPNS